MTTNKSFTTDIKEIGQRAWADMEPGDSNKIMKKRGRYFGISSKLWFAMLLMVVSTVLGVTVTNTGFPTFTAITGDLGLSPATAGTGVSPKTVKVNGTIHDATTAFNDAVRRSGRSVRVSGNLGGRTLTPGLYKSRSSLEISSGDLTLDAKGNADAVFIFQMASTLTITSGRHVILIGGAQAKNVFWQVGSSATLASIPAFKGNILAQTSITLNTGVRLNDRALARIGEVSLDTCTVAAPPSETKPRSVPVSEN
jgi:hypothetical protein